MPTDNADKPPKTNSPLPDSLRSGRKFFSPVRRRTGFGAETHILAQFIEIFVCQSGPTLAYTLPSPLTLRIHQRCASWGMLPRLGVGGRSGKLHYPSTHSYGHTFTGIAPNHGSANPPIPSSSQGFKTAALNRRKNLACSIRHQSDS